MDDQSTHLLNVRARLNALAELVDRMAVQDPAVPHSPEDREIIAVTAMIVATYRPRSRADVLRFVRAVKAGDEAFLLLHAVPGGERVDAAYFSHLPREARGLVK